MPLRLQHGAGRALEKGLRALPPAPQPKEGQRGGTLPTPRPGGVCLVARQLDVALWWLPGEQCQEPSTLRVPRVAALPAGAGGRARCGDRMGQGGDREPFRSLVALLHGSAGSRNGIWMGLGVPG